MRRSRRDSFWESTHRPTEIEITEAKSRLDMESASRIVDIVREFRSLGVHKYLSTVRACIMIAKVVALREARVTYGDPIFHETCRDVLRIDSIKITHDGNAVGTDWLDEIVTRHCSPSPIPHVALGNGYVKVTKAQTRNGAPVHWWTSPILSGILGRIRSHEKEKVKPIQWRAQGPVIVPVAARGLDPRTLPGRSQPAGGRTAERSPLAVQRASRRHRHRA
jgi:hypothetical protein